MPRYRLPDWLTFELASEDCCDVVDRSPSALLVDDEFDEELVIVSVTKLNEPDSSLPLPLSVVVELDVDVLVAECVWFVSVVDRPETTVDVLFSEKLPDTEFPDLLLVVFAVVEPLVTVNEGPLSNVYGNERFHHPT